MCRKRLGSSVGGRPVRKPRYRGNSTATETATATKTATATAELSPLRRPLPRHRRTPLQPGQPRAASTAAVVPAEEPEAEAGQAGPHPPQVVILLEPAVERQQHQEAEEPQRGADRDRAGAVDVEGLD